MLLLSGLLWDYGLEMLRGGYRKLVVAMALLVVVLSLVIVTGLSEGSGLSALDPGSHTATNLYSDPQCCSRAIWSDGETI